MADIYKPSEWSVQQLVDGVRSGTVRLPDLQRPFVWPKTKVRDLMDSMYRGFPVGELMFWNRPGDDETGTIGMGEKQHSSTHRIVDGQQRVTSMYVVVTGEPVVDDEYKEWPIRISFNPLIERFEVAQPALDKSAEWIPDISAVFKSSLKAHTDFVARIQKARGEALSDEEQHQIFQAIMRISALKDRMFKVVELLPDVDKSVVADVFVRINSEGVNLTSSDFILTWLSVFWHQGRDDIEAFARHSRLTADRITEITGTKTDWTPKNHYIAPDPGQLVRIAVAVGQKPWTPSGRVQRDEGVGPQVRHGGPRQAEGRTPEDPGGRSAGPRPAQLDRVPPSPGSSRVPVPEDDHVRHHDPLHVRPVADWPH